VCVCGVCGVCVSVCARVRVSEYVCEIVFFFAAPSPPLTSNQDENLDTWGGRVTALILKAVDIVQVCVCVCVCVCV